MGEYIITVINFFKKSLFQMPQSQEIELKIN